MILRAVLFVVVMAGVAGADLTPPTEFAACPRLPAGLEVPCTPEGPACDDGDPCNG